MSDNHHLICLYNLFFEDLNCLQILLLTDLLYSIQEDFIISLRKLDSREEIRDDTLKQRDIVGQEFGEIDIHDGTQQLKMSREVKAQ